MSVFALWVYLTGLSKGSLQAHSLEIQQVVAKLRDAHHSGTDSSLVEEEEDTERSR